MGTDRVGDVEERQAHLRRDVVRGRLREHVGRVALTQPVGQPVVQPPDRLHPGQDRLEALRVEGAPPKLVEVLHDEVEQIGARSTLDVAPQRRDRRLAAGDELLDDRGVRVQRSVRAAQGQSGRGRVRARPDEVARRDRAQRVADQRIRSADQPEEGGATRLRAQELGDVDEQPAAGDAHRPSRRQLPHREPERLHRLGHHLLVADGDVDPVLVVVGLRDREQRGDRPRLDDVEPVAGQAPLDVLRAAEARFDPAPQLRDPHGLVVGQRRPVPPVGLDRPLDDCAVAHPVGVRRGRPRHQRLAEPEDRLDQRHLPMPADGVGGEQHAGDLRRDHPLDDHRHPEAAVVEAVAQPVGHGSLGEQRSPARRTCRSTSSSPTTFR